MFIPAADFDYTHAKRVKKEELPTIRSTGNKIRLPLAVAMSYGVDVPLTIAGYTISPLVHLFLMPFEE